MLCGVQIIVTHDQEEAFDLADKVVIFNRGLIEQVGLHLKSPSDCMCCSL
jgi:ABC-type sulfate/molybdate transport systems ATPase subunit